MTLLFYLASTVAVIATLLAVTRRHAVHALLYLIVSLLAVILLGELFVCVGALPHTATPAVTISPKQVGTLLFGGYWIGVELASLLLMAGLVGAFHLGRHALAGEEKQHVTGTDTARLDSRSDLVHA